MTDVEKHPHWPWNRDYLAYNPNLTIDFVVQHPDWRWNWLYLSDTHFSMTDVENHINQPWDWGALSNNPTITVNHIEKHLEKDWDWLDLSVHRNISLADVERHPDWPWYWGELVRRHRFSVDFIEKHIGYIGLDVHLWMYISQYASITRSDVERHPEWPWRWEGLSKNSFNRVDAAITIQRWYRKCKGFWPWRRRTRWIRVAIDGSPWLPGAEYIAWHEFWVGPLTSSN